jgi:hypothetical protein
VHADGVSLDINEEKVRQLVRPDCIVIRDGGVGIMSDEKSKISRTGPEGFSRNEIRCLYCIFLE